MGDDRTQLQDGFGYEQAPAGAHLCRALEPPAASHGCTEPGSWSDGSRRCRPAAATTNSSSLRVPSTFPQRRVTTSWARSKEPRTASVTASRRNPTGCRPTGRDKCRVSGADVAQPGLRWATWVTRTVSSAVAGHPPGRSRSGRHRRGLDVCPAGPADSGGPAAARVNGARRIDPVENRLPSQGRAIPTESAQRSAPPQYATERPPFFRSSTAPPRAWPLVVHQV